MMTSLSQAGRGDHGQNWSEQFGGSVKARAAYLIIRYALTTGRLRPGLRLLDASSGNTWHALRLHLRSDGHSSHSLVCRECLRERIMILKVGRGIDPDLLAEELMVLNGLPQHWPMISRAILLC
ncbi:MAG: hypothetical protein R2787_12870 [Saprospiraceae bacterium]